MHQREGRDSFGLGFLMIAVLKMLRSDIALPDGLTVMAMWEAVKDREPVMCPTMPGIFQATQNCVRHGFVAPGGIFTTYHGHLTRSYKLTDKGRRLCGSWSAESEGLYVI